MWVILNCQISHRPQHLRFTKESNLLDYLMPKRLTNEVEPRFTLSSGRPHTLCFLFKGLIMGGGNKGTPSLFYVLNSVRGRKEVKGGPAAPHSTPETGFEMFLPRIRSCVPSVCSPWRLAALQEYRPWSEKATFVSSKEPSCRWWEEPNLLLFLNQVTSASGTPMETKICLSGKWQVNPGRWEPLATPPSSAGSICLGVFYCPSAKPNITPWVSSCL